MKQCTQCQRTFEQGDLTSCPDDGAEVVDFAAFVDAMGRTGAPTSSQQAVARPLGTVVGVARASERSGGSVSDSVGALGAAAAIISVEREAPSHAPSHAPSMNASAGSFGETMPAGSNSMSSDPSIGGNATSPAAGLIRDAGSVAPTAQVPETPPFTSTSPNYPPAVNSLEEGSQVGEYVVGRKIGEGGMGIIFAGVHPIIGKKVALKVLNGEMGSHPDVVARFIQEAKSVNQIGHRNIVDIFSFGRLSDGRHYFAMEFLQGQALAARLDSEVRVEWAEAIQIWLQVAAAIEAAHQHGIVHRDLKPDNVYLTPSPEGPFVKVLDFGIAKLLGDGPPGISKTGTGVPIGTPTYMSPEQAEGSKIDHRADLYAFGIILFETITGRPPFLEQTFIALLTAHLTTPPPPLATLVDIHPDLDRLVMQLLLKRPEERPQDMTTVRAELVRLRDLALAEGIPLYAPLGQMPTERKVKAPLTAPRSQALSVELSAERAVTTQRDDLSDSTATTDRPIALAEPKRSPVPLIALALVAVGGGALVFAKIATSHPHPTPPVVIATPQVVPQPPPIAPPAVPTTGRLIVNTNVNGTKLYLDKSLKEKSAVPIAAGSGLVKAQVPAGVEWILRVEADGFQPYTMPLMIAAGDESAVPIGMVPIGSKAKPTIGHPGGDKGHPVSPAVAPVVAPQDKVKNPKIVDPFAG